MHPSVESAVPAGDINILVVDAVEQNLIAIEALLARRGVTVLTASSGPAALEILAMQEVALMLLDAQIPGTDGGTLAEAVRGSPQGRAIPLIFLLAAVSAPPRGLDAGRTGAVDFLYLPVEPDMLRSKVDGFIELAALKKQVTAQHETLQKALRANEIFTAVLGHDLRSPLGAVLNGAELLLLIPADQKVGAIASRIRSSARRMEKMVSQLLDVAHAHAGGIALELGRGDYAQVCRRVADELRQAGHGNPVQIDASDRTDGRFDPLRIGQALSNLLGNALQHGEPDGGVTVRIDGADPDQVTLSIHNRGAMPAAVVEQAFTPLRPGRDARTQPGVGLGLYMAKYFVDAHGGSIALDSSAASGTTITLRLPREAAAGE